METCGEVRYNCGENNVLIVFCILDQPLGQALIAPSTQGSDHCIEVGSLVVG